MRTPRSASSNAPSAKHEYEPPTRCARDPQGVRQAASERPGAGLTAPLTQKYRRTQMAWTREEMAQRAAKELQDGFYVNLGIGLPTLVANHVPEGMEVWLQSENGLLGIGPFPTEDE